MHRSLMIMAVMGVLAMVLLTVFGSFFVGHVGGATNVGTLQKNIVDVFGSYIADPEKSMSVTVRQDGDVTGLEIAYTPKARLAANEKALRYHMGRVATYVMSLDYWRKHAAWVELNLALPQGRSVSERFVQKGRTVPMTSDT